MITSPQPYLKLKGTTGNPKGALMTHHNLVNNGRDFGYRIGYHEKEHAICCNPPFFHTFGLTIGLIAGLFHGAKLVCAAPRDVYRVTIQVDSNLLLTPKKSFVLV